ncbi:MAG: hypothetical protein EHM33_00400 [Chloroflexi bacterium]|nr:MAG: hypothetical protein EHM33_00400 [Chloroflexota bacterium]
MPALALELSIRSRPTRGGGGGPPPLLGNGVLLDAATDILKINDSITPANAYEGPPGPKFGNVRNGIAMLNNQDGTVGYGPENLDLWSDDFSNAAWQHTDWTATVNDTLAPDGTMTADLITTGSAGNALVQPTAGRTIMAGDVCTISCYVKKGPLNDWFLFQHWTPASVTVSQWFNLATGTMGVSSPLTPGTTGQLWLNATIEPAANGFYRLSVTGIIGKELTSRGLLLACTANSLTTRVPNATYHLWGYQFERIPAPYTPTFYKPTTSSTWNGLRRDYDRRISQPGYLIENAHTNVVLQSNDLSITHHLTGTNIAGGFTDGETVNATGGGTGKIILNGTTATFYVISGGTGTFTGTLTGATSGATRNITGSTPVWVSTMFGVAKNQTGPDGKTLSATDLVPGPGPCTILQTTTIASSARFMSAYVKRSIAGTGLIEMTTDGGTTWVAISPTTSWARFTIPTQTLANPVVGFRLAFPDRIAVWGVQNEALCVSSPILTTTATATRFADIPKLTTSQCSINNAEGTLYSKFITQGDPVGVGGTSGSMNLDATATTTLVNGIRTGTSGGANYGKLTVTGYDNGGLTMSWAATQTIIPLLGTCKLSVGYKLNDCALSSMGEVPLMDVAWSPPVTQPFNLIVLGNRNNGLIAAEGWVLEGLYSTTRQPDDTLKAWSTP